ncbi:MAG: sensor domain-containing diguanylate cyclase [Thermodesulfobacteriota bacterium]
MASSDDDQTGAELRILMDNVPAVLFKGYLDGAIDLDDRKVEAMTGFSPEDFMSRRLKWTDLMLAEDRDSAKSIFIQALKTNKTYVREYRIRGKAENIIWVHERSHIVCNADGKVKYVSGLFFDVTETKHLEEKLRETEKELRIVIDNIPAILFKGYLDGSVETLDGKLEAMTGYPKDEFASRRLKWTDLIFEEDREQTREVFIHALKTNKSYVREYRIRPKTGEVLWVQERSHIVCDAKGKVEYVSGLFFDITERKVLEAAVAERNAQLQEANARLQGWAKELEQRNTEITLLGQMGELLQSCNTTEEAYLVIRQSLKKLFPVDSGAVFLINNSRTLVEAASLWGDIPPAELVFTPDECWALRRGRVHGATEIHSGFHCRHVARDQRSYLCVPLVAQSETIGIFHVLLGSEDLKQVEAKQNLAFRVSDHLGLALAKLKLQETLQNLSVRDPLTGLFNRRYLEESMERELRRAERQGKQVGVIMADIDHFKRFNDTFGHEAGDTLLKEVGKVLGKHIRGSDIACRYGGEEFTIIMQDVSMAITQQRAEQLLDAIRRLKVYHGDRGLDPVTLSLGVAIFPEHGDTYKAVLQAADVALYQAKQSGRDRVCLAGRH